MLRMFTAVTALSVVASIILALTWPSESPSGDDGQITGLYENDPEGFSVVLPVGWVGTENETRSPLLSITTTEDVPGAAAEIWIFSRSDDSSAEAWLDSQISRLGFDDVRLSVPAPYQGALSGHRATMAYTQDNGNVLIQMWTVVVRGSQIFLLRTIAHEATWPAVQPYANAFMGSFTLRSPVFFGAAQEDSLFQYWGEIVTIDPALTQRGAGGIVGAIFSGLVTLNNRLEVAADLAEGWEVSDDRTVYTFTLRDNARFHDGRAVTAHDFKYSWERALHPYTESTVAETYLGDIVGGEALASGEAETLEGVQALDDLTLQVTITDPFPYFLAKLTYPTSFVVDRDNVETGDTWTDSPNGTGAFKLKTWNKDQLLVLERNEDWYRGAPALAHAVYRIFAGRPMQMYERGEIDMTRIGIHDIDRARDPANALNADLREGTALCTSYLGFNVSRPPFDDPKVRQALALVLEVDKQLEVTHKGLSKRAAGFVPPAMFAHNESLEPTPFEPETAIRLLEESGYGGAENLPPIKSFSDDDAIHWAWREHLGLEVEAVSVFEFADFLERLDKKELGVFSTGWCADYPDPQNFLDVLFHSESEGNRFDYSNEDVDALLEQAAVEEDPDRRAELYQQAESLVLDDWVAVPLRHSTRNVLVRPYVKGYELTPIGIPQLHNISIERGP